jgi:1-deoxy-D-xylulose-5-phosphate reductoisomerase
MKSVVILGSTGSIGTKTLDVISRLNDKFKVIGLTCDSNAELLLRQIKLFNPQIAAIRDVSKYKALKDRLGSSKTKLYAGMEGIIRVAAHNKSDIVVIAISGSLALAPLLAAIKLSKKIALANKESLVMAGELVISLAREKKSQIIPIDSEHSAIFQCLNLTPTKLVKRLIITGSGGPLNNIAKSSLHKVKPKDALNHPKWDMGKKISIDSATLMNKGLEVIEAHWLFGIDAKNIDVLIHPEAIVHSMVEFIDGSIIAQLGPTDMRFPIQYALTHPDRFNSHNGSLDLTRIKNLSFKSPDFEKFPCLHLAYEALSMGGTSTAVLNGANEELVHLYLKGIIAITDIPRYIARVLDSHKVKKSPDLEDIMEADRFARSTVKEFLAKE